LLFSHFEIPVNRRHNSSPQRFSTPKKPPGIVATSDKLDPLIHRVIAAHAESMAQLEILLFLHTDPRRRVIRHQAPWRLALT